MQVWAFFSELYINFKYVDYANVIMWFYKNLFIVVVQVRP